jgi:hypothetical protein
LKNLVFWAEEGFEARICNLNGKAWDRHMVAMSHELSAIKSGGGLKKPWALTLALSLQMNKSFIM